jgi:transglutaminase-like putative cysteine protease
MNHADLDACRFRMRSSHVPLRQAIEDYAGECFPPGRPIGTAARALTRQIHRDFDYVPGSTNNRTLITEVLANRRGVCQDFAHLMIGCLRSSGLAARYVSGYIRTARAGESDALVGGDVSHAWVSVYCPPLGWIDFDPTNDCVVGEDHVTLAWGRDFDDVSPLRGMIVGGGRHKVSVDVGVRRLD